MSFEATRAAGLTRASCMHVVDGDTADFLLDLGWFQYAYVTLRFAGVNAPELHDHRKIEAMQARTAKHRVEALLLGACVLVESHREQTTFGRFVAKIYAPASADSECPEVVRCTIGGTTWLDVTAVLVHEGLAVAAPA